jgi:hypothetical protein
MYGRWKVRLKKEGNVVSMQKHTFVFCLANPDKALEVTNTDSKQFHISHLCANGGIKEEITLSQPESTEFHNCVNPRHLCFEAASINQDRKGCKYGCGHLCPHDPPCIFVDDNFKEIDGNCDHP